MDVFALLYPWKADFEHIFGYKWAFLCSCTRDRQIPGNRDFKRLKGTADCFVALYPW